MTYFDYIINPTTGKKVKITSTLGKKILEAYKNLHQYGSGMDLVPEKDEILREYTEEMRNLGLILTDQMGWYSRNKGGVFFEGDKVLIDIREPEMQILSKGYSNAIGKIINPETISNKVYKNYFPDIKPYQDQSRFTYPFIYTPSFGNAITEIHRGTDMRNQDFSDYVRDEPRLNLYLQMLNRQREEDEQFSIPEYNKSTSNPFDVSFRFRDSEKNIRKYLVEWDEKDAEGNNKLSIFNAEHLIHLSDKDELLGYDLTSSDEEDHEESSDDEQEESAFHESMRLKLGKVILKFRLMDLTQRDPIRLTRGAYNILMRLNVPRDNHSGVGFRWIDEADDIMKDIIYNSRLTHRPNQIQEVRRLLRQFAEHMAFLMSYVNEQPVPRELAEINLTIDEIGVPELIRRINQDEQEDHDVDDDGDDDGYDDGYDDGDSLTRLEERFQALTNTEESQDVDDRDSYSSSDDYDSVYSESGDEGTGEEESDNREERRFFIGVVDDLEDTDNPTSTLTMIHKISHAQYDIGLTEMSPNRFNELITGTFDFNEPDEEVDQESEDYIYLTELYETLGNLEFVIREQERSEIRTELDNFATKLSNRTELFEVTADDPPVDWDTISSNLDRINIDSLIRRYV